MKSYYGLLIICTLLLQVTMIRTSSLMTMMLMVMVWMRMDLSSFLAGLKLTEQFFLTHCIFKSYIIVVKMGLLNVISMSIFMAVLWWVKSKDHQTLLVSNTKMFQERSWLGDGYVQRLGFLGLAEENNIVMMFPQVSFVHHKGAGNNSLFDQKYISLDSTLSCARESQWMLVGEISKKV